MTQCSLLIHWLEIVRLAHVSLVKVGTKLGINIGHTLHFHVLNVRTEHSEQAHLQQNH